MLAEFGAQYAVIGHSERRARHAEAGDAINAKVHAAIRNQIIPIVCVGGELEVRRAGKHVEHTVTQVCEALTGVGTSDVTCLMVAYEPVWAIGTGEVATLEDAQEVCAAIRGEVTRLAGAIGGSVKPRTTSAILSQPDVDGAPVGGASLDAGQLLAIWAAARQTSEATRGSRVNH